MPKMPAQARPLYACILIKPMALTWPCVQTTRKASCTTPSVAWMVEAIVKREVSLAWCDKSQEKNMVRSNIDETEPSTQMGAPAIFAISPAVFVHIGLFH